MKLALNLGARLEKLARGRALLRRFQAALILTPAVTAGWLCLAPCGAALAEGLTNLLVPLPVGETALTDIGLYQVWWQSYGGEPVQMPVSWTGHADERSGVSYKPWGRVLGREALLIHSPWRVEVVAGLAGG